MLGEGDMKPIYLVIHESIIINQRSILVTIHTLLGFT